jgi:hypothetical protein
MAEGRAAYRARRRADAIRAYQAALDEKPGDYGATLGLNTAGALPGR